MLKEREAGAIQGEMAALEWNQEEQYKGINTTGHALYHAIKRITDFLLSLCALIVLSPVFLITAILVKKEDGGPVFYKSERLGQYGKKIYVLKFRSMQMNAAKLEDILTPGELVEYYQEYKLDHDPRITKIGKVLRRSSIDELPQLLNILCGEMSIVGPRPIVDKELKEKYTPKQQALLLSVKPGLTGAWQVYGRSNCTYKSGVRQKVELAYVQNCGIKADAMIVLKTIPVTILKVGAK